MRAWTIARTGPLAAAEGRPLALVERPAPEPGPGEVLLRVERCGVCHTELDELEGRAAPPRLPVVPGHQVVGTVAALGAGVRARAVGERVGLAWIGGACGCCRFCADGRENLCAAFVATGRDRDGGYAELAVADADYCVPVPDGLEPSSAAPLLCAGAVGYRALRLAALRDGEALGLTGFGASNHLVLAMARALYPASPVYVFARSERQRAFALERGATWTGDTRAQPPRPCRSVIDSTPAWVPDLAALDALEPGGRLVINAIRKEAGDRAELATLDYERQLWMEKQVQSVANVARADVEGCLQLAAEHPELAPRVEEYAFEDANRALLELAAGDGIGAKVLVVRGQG